MWVGEIDVHDDELFHAFWEAGRQGDKHGREFSTYWSLQSAKGSSGPPTTPPSSMP